MFIKQIIFIKKLFNYKNYIFFIGFALCIKLVYLFTFHQYHTNDREHIFFLRGDAEEYVRSCENLHNDGVYYSFTSGNKLSYTNRMPGMCVIYNPLRLFFNKKTTLDIFIIIQTLISAIATYLLALATHKVFKSLKSFYISFFLFAFSTYCANYNGMLYTESLAVSSIIISIYLFLSYIEKRKKTPLIFSSIFMAWAIMLRPYIAPFTAIMILILIIDFIKSKNTYKDIIIYLLPLFIIFGLWTYRNYLITHKFIPLQTSNIWHDNNKAVTARIKFINTFGLSWMWWDPESAHTWFMSDSFLKPIKVNRPDDSILPDYIFTKELTLDTLKYARECYWKSIDTNYSSKERKRYSKTCAIILNKFSDTFQKKHPLKYKIETRLRLLKSFLDQPIGAPLKSVKYPFNVIFVFFDSFINYLVIICGLIFFIKAVQLSFKDITILLLAFIPAFIIFYFPIHLRTDEYRFLNMAYPFLLIFASRAIDIITESKYKFILLSVFFVAISILSINSVMVNIRW